MKPTQKTNSTPSEELLAVSLELSKNSWKIALHDGRREKPAIHTVASEQAPKRLAESVAVIEGAKRKWGLSGQTRIVVLYEAGQDGLHKQPTLVDGVCLIKVTSAQRACRIRLDYKPADRRW